MITNLNIYTNLCKLLSYLSGFLNVLVKNRILKTLSTGCKITQTHIFHKE